MFDYLQMFCFWWLAGCLPSPEDLHLPRISRVTFNHEIELCGRRRVDEGTTALYKLCSINSAEKFRVTVLAVLLARARHTR